MPLSLALRTATVATQLPVIQAVGESEAQSAKKYRRFFGGHSKPLESPTNYELAGRSTYTLVHGAILRYHSAFGDDPDVNATPTSTHFLNGSSIAFVTDAVQGFKWVLEIKTWSKGHHTMRSPLKKSKSSKDIRDRNVDLTKAPWGVVDGVQAWYLIFETPNLMTEWMTVLRVAIADLKAREAKGEKSPSKTPKPALRTPTKSPAKQPRYMRSPGTSSPATSISESLPSSPSSSRKSFIGRGVDGFLSKRSSVADSALDEHSATTLFRRSSNQTAVDESPPPTGRRQPSQQDIALTAFRISAYEEDLASFVPPVQEPTTPEIRLVANSIKSDSEYSHHSNHAALSPNLSYYSHKRASIISLQSRLSSVSSGLRTPNTAMSPTSSPAQKSRRRTLRRTISGESNKTNNSWKQYQNIPPPHPPPTGPLPEPPSHSNYLHGSGYHAELFARRPSSGVFERRESLVLGISPVFETDTPKTLSHITPRSSPLIRSTPAMGGIGSSVQSVKVTAS